MLRICLYIQLLATVTAYMQLQFINESLYTINVKTGSGPGRIQNLELSLSTSIFLHLNDTSTFSSSFFAIGDDKFDTLFINQKSVPSKYTLGKGALSLGWFAHGPATLEFPINRLYLGLKVMPASPGLNLSTVLGKFPLQVQHTITTMELGQLWLGSSFLLVPPTIVIDRTINDCFYFPALSGSVCTLDQVNTPDGPKYTIQGGEESLFKIGTTIATLPLRLHYIPATGAMTIAKAWSSSSYTNGQLVCIFLLVIYILLWVLFFRNEKASPWHTISCALVMNSILGWQLMGDFVGRLQYISPTSVLAYGPLTCVTYVLMNVVYLMPDTYPTPFVRTLHETILVATTLVIFLGPSILCEEMLICTSISLIWVLLRVFDFASCPSHRWLILAIILLFYPFLICVVFYPFVLEIPEMNPYGWVCSNMIILLPVLLLVTFSLHTELVKKMQNKSL